MANFTPSPQAPEREHSLPSTFIDKREEFYANKSTITKARILRDGRMLKEAVIEYMSILDYICNRIKPKLRGKYRQEIIQIQAYIPTALNSIRASDGIPDEVLEQIDYCHDITTEAMVSYGFDQITPTVLNI